jgi:arylsulfatase A-like enzyme
MFPRTRERNKKFETAVDYFNKRDYRTTVISDFAGDIFQRIDLGFNKISTPDMNLPILLKQIILEKQTFLLPFITNKLGLFIFPELKGIAKLPVPEVLTEETISEIKSARGKPFFILSFYSITHFPFSSSYPYYKKYSAKNYNGPHKYYKDRVLKLDNSGSSQSEKETAEDNKQVNALYDGCLNQFDFEVGKIIDFLKKKDLLDNTIVIITSDHGENLYEKNFGMGHGEHLRGNYSLEVPFIIYSPRAAAGTKKIFEQTSSIVDIMPTVFETAKFSIPEYFEGASIFQKAQNIVRDKDYDIDAYCETGMWFDNDKSSPYFFHHERIDYPDISGVSEIDFSFKSEVVISQRYNNIVNGAKHRTIYSGRYKLIYIPLRKGAKFELYDYARDPDNKYDLSGSRTDILNDMKKKFYSFINENSSGNYIIDKEIVYPVFFDPVF